MQGEFGCQQSINSNMIRHHNALQRGISHDDRLKAKTKKRPHAQQDRRQDCIPSVSNAARPPNKNVAMLMQAAQSMMPMLQKYGDMRYKAKDEKILSLIIKELTLLSQLQEQERVQNSGKVKEYKVLLEHLREQKEEALQEIQKTRKLMTSGSPRCRNGVIAYEMSPKMIDRKMEEQRQRPIFQSIKKKDMCFGRVFEHIDRIADKLNLSKGEKIALSFKNFISRIEAAIQAIGQREVELKSAIKDAAQYQIQLTTLKAENDLLAQQNIALRRQVNALTLRLEKTMTTHETQMNAMLNKCTELQEDFQLIVKEKLDAETALSQQGKRHREATRGLQRKAKRLRECLREAKYLQTQLKQTVKEHRNNLECYSRETFNEVICAYTQELVGNAARSKRERVEMERERERVEMERERERVETERERERREKDREVEAEQRISRMGIVQTLQQYICQRREKMLSLQRGEDVVYTPHERQEQLVQTQDQKQKCLTYHSSLIQHVFFPIKRHFSICNNAFDIVQVPQRQFNVKDIQTDQQKVHIHVSQSYSQTISQQYSAMEVQTTTDSTDANIQSSTPTLTHHSQYTITIPQVIRTAVNASTATPISIPIDASTNTTPSTLAIYPALCHTLPSCKQSVNQHTSTQQYQTASLGANTSIIQTNDQETNTIHEYIHHQHTTTPQIETPIDQLEEECTQSILDLLVQAEQVINVPEICLLREEIVTYRGEIDRLTKTIEGLKNEKEHVFQFCY